MNLVIREARSEEKDAIRTLLEKSGLPTETVSGGQTRFYAGWVDDWIAGVAGLEFYGSDWLLRSVAVVPELRGTGLGIRLVEFMIAQAKVQGVSRLFLLTETAEGFFRKAGFKRIDRSTITNPALTQSSEFATVCPASAVCMELDVTSLAA
jgi:amino-acid N-acetyltransferase